jgi:hypothetical protein
VEKVSHTAHGADGASVAYTPFGGCFPTPNFSPFFANYSIKSCFANSSKTPQSRMAIDFEVVFEICENR